MSYGTPEWMKWVLEEEEGIAQIKFAYVMLFDRAELKLKRPCPCPLVDFRFSIPPPGPIRYSYENGIQTFDTADVSHKPLAIPILQYTFA